MLLFVFRSSLNVVVLNWKICYLLWLQDKGRGREVVVTVEFRTFQTNILFCAQVFGLCAPNLHLAEGNRKWLSEMAGVILGLQTENMLFAWFSDFLRLSWHFNLIILIIMKSGLNLKKWTCRTSMLRVFGTSLIPPDNWKIDYIVENSSGRNFLL